MNKKRIIIIFIGLTLFGCAGLGSPQMVWDRSEPYTQADFDKDWAQCKYEADVYSPITGPGGGIAAGIREAQLTIECMQARGWRRVPQRQ